MAGKSGRSGGKNRVSAPLHRLRGTWRDSRHGAATAPSLPVIEPAPRPPSGLSADGRRFWREVSSRWRLDEPRLRLLRLCCQAWDDGQVARKALRGGRTVTMPSGATRPHPAVRDELEARRDFARLLAQLGLEEEQQ